MRKRTYLLMATAASLILLVAAASFAWYYQYSALATLLEIAPPDSIKIVPVDDNGGEVTMLDLDFNEVYGDKKVDNIVTIYRPLNVVSTSPVHQLEIVHTTNLENFSFKIYWTDGNVYKNIDDVIDNGHILTGEYKNKQSNSPLAVQDKLNNYKEGDNIEEHAYPLYWLANTTGDKEYVDGEDDVKVDIEVKSSVETKFDPAKQTDRNFYTTKYYLVISWEETGKETDLFYIIAQNVAVTEKGEGGTGS